RHLVGGGHRVLAELTGPAVLVAHDIGPGDVALLDGGRVRAFVTEVGGRTSHSAIVARGRGIPAVVGLRGLLHKVRAGDTLIVDGFSGEIELNPDQETAERYRGYRARLDQHQHTLDDLQAEPAVTPDGRRIELAANIELPAEVEQVLGCGADGVGLF